jgi:hypothetical protein
VKPHSRFGLLAIALALAFTLAPSVQAADECGRCQLKIEAKKKLRDSEAEYTDLLRRNKEFLAKIGPSDNSKLVKLNSNITLINIKLEGIQKNIAELDSELAKEDCAPCMPKESSSEDDEDGAKKPAQPNEVKN